MSVSSYWFSFMGSSIGDWVRVHSLYGSGKMIFSCYLLYRLHASGLIVHSSSVHDIKCLSLQAFISLLCILNNYFWIMLNINPMKPNVSYLISKFVRPLND